MGPVWDDNVAKKRPPITVRGSADRHDRDVKQFTARRAGACDDGLSPADQDCIDPQRYSMQACVVHGNTYFVIE
jgi:hypothetical protein